ncbi:MAG: PorP/SprF family type IX secretion system membrane protein [Mucilaginibacter sp.]
MKKILLVVCVLMAGFARVQAQVDPHFSQYYAYPLWLNPALTGLMDGDLRVSGNFKNQWNTIDGGYKSTALSADYRPTSQTGVGFNVLNQKAGTAGYNYFAASGSFGYGVKLANQYQWLNFGIQAGIINRSIDPSKFRTESQYNPGSGGYDPNLPSNENFLSNSATVFDAGAGVFYHDDSPDKKTNFFAGISLAHLSRPTDPFSGVGTDYKLPVRYTLHGGLRVNVSQSFALTPNAIYIKQAKSEIKAFGAYSEIKFSNQDIFMVGAMYRTGDAAVANVGYRIGNLTIGASYDFNTSAFSTATNSQGGIELSVSYVFRKGKFGPSPVCPKL